MSHFSVLVIGSDAEEQLSRYDENLDMDMHLYKTREQIIEDKKEWMEMYKENFYSKYLANPEEYKKNCQNPSHLEYIEKGFPKMLEWSDDEIYEHAIADYRQEIEEGESNYEIHDDGSLWSVFNGEAKWDWYQLGGRFRGRLKLVDGAEPLADLYDGWQYEDNGSEYKRLVNEGRCDKARKGDIENWLDDDFTFFAVLKDGIWYERGEMGGWATVSNDKGESSWKDEMKAILSDVLDDDVVSVYDCHI